MASIIFTCPATREHVQHPLPDGDPLAPKEHVGIRCAECDRIHFVNRDGKVFRADRSQHLERMNGTARR